MKPNEGRDKRRRDELRERIQAMLASGMTQAAIARQLHKSVSTIAFHVRNLGVKPKEYSTPEPVKNGKRRCTSCGNRKTLGAFQSERHAECTMCVRNRGKE